MADKIPVVAALIERDGLLLAAKRQDRAEGQGAWEFPGGKCRDGEQAEDALKREIKEELGATLQTLWHLDTKLTAPKEGQVFEIAYYVCTLQEGEEPHVDPSIHSKICWIDAPQLLNLDWISPDKELALSLGQAWEEIFSTNRL